MCACALKTISRKSQRAVIKYGVIFFLLFKGASLCFTLLLLSVCILMRNPHEMRARLFITYVPIIYVWLDLDALSSF